MKQVGIQLGGEGSVRKYSRDIIKQFVPVENRTVTKEDGEFEAPYGRISDLTTFIDYLLDSYEESQMLTWHDCTIPSNEIWVKVWGAHRKNSFKFAFQIAITDKPNSQLNTIAITMVVVQDNHENLVLKIDIYT